jgi:hypothetical protein
MTALLHLRVPRQRARHRMTLKGGVGPGIIIDGFGELRDEENEAKRYRSPARLPHPSPLSRIRSSKPMQNDHLCFL